MRPEAITDVLCLLFLFYVNSQTSCPSGWFGDQCKYKCRCELDTCDATGECTEKNTCWGGWFGPACQYADLAYDTMNDAAVVDGDESTCLTGTKTQVTIKLKQNLPFTWLRATVANQGSADLKYLTVSLGHGSNAACPNQRKQIVDNNTVDIHCDLSGFTDVVILKGSAVAFLCSVYISGGRNVAIKENATQDDYHTGEYDNNVTIEYTADKAVDGDRDPDFIRSHTCTHSSYQLNGSAQPTWSVTLSKQRRVDRYVLYNRMGVCDPGTFGPECKLACNEGCGETACDRMTGTCTKGCKSGFIGANCEKECGVGTFGENCKSSCSPRCKPSDDLTISPCNHETGSCINGCKSGYSGDDCAAAPSTKEPTSGSYTELIVGLCATISALMLIGYFMCKKKQTRPMEEGAFGHLPSVAEDTAL